MPTRGESRVISGHLGHSLAEEDARRGRANREDADRDARKEVRPGEAQAGVEAERVAPGRPRDRSHCAAHDHLDERVLDVLQTVLGGRRIERGLRDLGRAAELSQRYRPRRNLGALPQRGSAGRGKLLQRSKVGLARSTLNEARPVSGSGGTQRRSSRGRRRGAKQQGGEQGR